MVINVDQLKKQQEAIDSEIKLLSTFRPTPQRQKFLRQLHGEQSYLLGLIQKATATVQQREADRLQRLARAQHNRIEKNRRNWRYYNAVATTWGYPVKLVRTEGKKRRRGLKSAIEDIKWRNPSP